LISNYLRELFSVVESRRQLALFEVRWATLAHRVETRLRLAEGAQMSVLSDNEISAEIAKGSLIKDGDSARLAGACYELRMGNTYYDLTESDEPIIVPAGGTVLIKPGHRVVLITHEELAVPNDFLARVVSKGSLFSVGLSPVATYADPGFFGNMGIVTENISDKYIVLPTLEPIAKVDFTRLRASVNRPYSGQHGFKTKIWPIKHELQKTYAQISNDPRIGTEKEEAYKLLPQATADVLTWLERRQRLTDVAILFAVILNALTLFLVGNDLVAGVLGVVGNLVASVVVGVVVLYTNFNKQR
jgi:dCTP deaminase